MTLTEEIREKAIELGFDLVGVTGAEPANAGCIDAYRQWLDRGFAGQMLYMHRNFEKRFTPREILPGAKSVIVTAINYKPVYNAPQKKGEYGKVVSFAQYEDYHIFIKQKLYELVEYIKGASGEENQFRICVDSEAFADKVFAQRAGLGFIGKNHLLINQRFGPQLLLGEVITTIELQPEKFVKADCSNCSRCISACPTGALREDGFLDANRCISYLTIEYKGDFPDGLAEKIGSRIFGCEDCILACPYQENSPVCSNSKFNFYPQRAQLNLNEILKLDEKAFEKKFADSPLKRCGLKRLQRNARCCLQNIRKTASR